MFKRRMLEKGWDLRCWRGALRALEMKGEEWGYRKDWERGDEDGKRDDREMHDSGKTDGRTGGKIAFEDMTSMGCLTGWREVLRGLGRW